MTNNPIVSVIMSEFNTEPEKLDISIQSILDQTFTNFEFIIIDDCGSNDLFEFTKKYNDSRIIVLRNKKNRGLVYSLNKAISHSKGGYLLRMDTDDYAFPNRISVLYEFIKNHPQFSVVSSRVVKVQNGEDAGILGKTGEKKTSNILSGDVPIHPSCILEKRAVQYVGGYKEFKRAEDFALWCELLLHGFRIYNIKDKLLKYTVDIEDYSKRKLANRKGELQARFYYNKKLHGGKIGYFRIIKSVIAGVIPVSFIKFYRKKTILKNKKNTSNDINDW